MKTSRLLIDGDILTYRTCWAVQTEVEWDDGIVTLGSNLAEVEMQADQMIHEWTEKLGIEDFVICFSAKGGKYFRHKILETYKANRKATRKPIGYNHLRKYLEEKYYCTSLPELEADDVLGILATDKTHDENIIVSVDKDMLTIPCQYYNMDTKILEQVLEPIADYMFYFQTLVGDSTDNYKGCPKVGPVRAREILTTPIEGEEAPFYWPRVVKAFEKQELTEEDALQQARVARILRTNDYDMIKKEVKLWQPPIPNTAITVEHLPPCTTPTVKHGKTRSKQK